VGRGASFEPPLRLLLRSALVHCLATTAAYVPSPLPPFPRPDMLLIVRKACLPTLQNRGQRADTATEISRPRPCFVTELCTHSLHLSSMVCAKQRGVVLVGGGEASCCVPSFWRSLRGGESRSPSYLTAKWYVEPFASTQPAAVARVPTRSTRFAP
jgi:hypothetical protein